MQLPGPLLKPKVEKMKNNPPRKKKSGKGTSLPQKNFLTF